MDSETPAAAPSLLDAVATADAQADLRPEATVAPEPARVARFVLFSVASTCYGVSEGFVTELRRIPKITIVPQTPSWLRGVANLRGDVLSVVDLRAYLGLDATSPHSGRMLIVRLLDEEFAVGLLVDAVDRIIALEPEDIRPPASPLEGPLAPFMTGVCVVDERLVVVLDLGRLLRSPDIRQFDEGKED